jgi:hypothetical protein
LYYNAIITGVDKPTAEEDTPKVGNCMEKDSPKVDNCKEILISKQFSFMHTKLNIYNFISD